MQNQVTYILGDAPPHHRRVVLAQLLQQLDQVLSFQLAHLAVAQVKDVGRADAAVVVVPGRQLLHHREEVLRKELWD